MADLIVSPSESTHAVAVARSARLRRGLPRLSGKLLVGMIVLAAIVLFGPGRIRWADTPSVRGPVRMGELLALPRD